MGALRPPARRALPRPSPLGAPPAPQPHPSAPQEYPQSPIPPPPPHLLLVRTYLVPGTWYLVPGTKIQTYCTRFGYLGLVVTRRPCHERTSTTSGPRLGARGPEGASAAAAPGRPLSEPYGGDRGGRRPRHPPLGGGRDAVRHAEISANLAPAPADLDPRRGPRSWGEVELRELGGFAALAPRASWRGPRSPAARLLPPARSGKGPGSLEGGRVDT